MYLTVKCKKLTKTIQNMITNNAFLILKHQYDIPIILVKLHLNTNINHANLKQRPNQIDTDLYHTIQIPYHILNATCLEFKMDLCIILHINEYFIQFFDKFAKLFNCQIFTFLFKFVHS